MPYALRALVLIGLCGLSGIALADGVYRWRDSSGQVHYSDRPGAPGAVPVAPLRVSPPVSNDPDRAHHEIQTRRLLRAFEEERAEERTKAEHKRRTAEERKRNCGIARDRLQGYRTARYLYRINSDGQRVILSDAGRTRALDDARLAVRQWCATPGGD